MKQVELYKDSDKKRYNVKLALYPKRKESFLVIETAFWNVNNESTFSVMYLNKETGLALYELLKGEFEDETSTS